MKSGYYRPFSVFLAILFLFASVVSRSQSVVQPVNHISNTSFKHVTDHTLTNSTQLAVEEKEGKDAESVSGSFTLLYLINAFSFSKSEDKQLCLKLIDSSPYFSVPRFIAIRTLLI
ncbi:MAG: hypothetical protein MUC73_04380 [Cyclobacteriaceae bacterium]|nr:hypothetical protein [Cyclobacteriaceae bacterium]